jgi:hypothetical protein
VHEEDLSKGQGFKKLAGDEQSDSPIRFGSMTLFVAACASEPA